MAVILSAAKNLSRITGEILRCAQDDNQENGQVISAQSLSQFARKIFASHVHLGATGIMRIATRMVLAGLGVLLATQYVSVASEADSHHPFAISKRVPWTTSRVKGTPDPPSPYRTEPAFPHLKFEEPLAMTCAPKGDRLFVTERFGRVYSFPNDPEVKKAELFLDLNEGLEGVEAKRRACYGFAIHPEFATNGYVYITYVLDAIEERPQGHT